MLKKICFALLLAASQFLRADCKEANSKKNEIIPRSVLMAYPEKSAVKMNRAGDKIAYIFRNDSNVGLRITDTNGNVIKEFEIKAARDMYDYVWSYNGDYILIPQDTEGDENNHIIALNIRTGEKKDLTPFKKARSSIEAMSKKYPDNIVITCNKRKAQWFDVYEVNIKDGSLTLLFENNEFSEFTCDNDLNIRLAMKTMSDGSLNTYKIVSGKKGELFKKTKFEETYNSGISHFSADGKTLYILSSENRDTNALYAHDLASGKNKLLFANDKADIESISYDPKSYAPQIAFVDYMKSEAYAVDSSFASDLDVLKKGADGSVSILSRSLDDKKWLIAYTSSMKSPQYYMYNRANHDLKFLFSARPDLDQYELQPMEPVVIKSRDGLNLVCYLTKAKNFKPNGKLVMHIHGGPWARNRLGLFAEVQLLANRGYSVLQVNYRGSIGFGKSFINAINKNLPKVRNDIIDAVNWAIEHHIAAKDKVAIMGGSFGGYSTLAGLAYTPQMFCCGVDIVGPSNWMTLFRSVPEYWKPFMIGWYKVGADPNTEEGQEELWNLSPLSRANDIAKPLIVFQGQNDPRVNMKESEQIVSALGHKKIPVVYVLYPDEGHGFLREPNRISYLAITEQFLAKFLGGWYEPIGASELEGSSYKIEKGKEFIKVE